MRRLVNRPIVGFMSKYPHYRNLQGFGADTTASALDDVKKAAADAAASAVWKAAGVTALVAIAFIILLPR